MDLYKKAYIWVFLSWLTSGRKKKNNRTSKQTKKNQKTPKQKERK